MTSSALDGGPGPGPGKVLGVGFNWLADGEERPTAPSLVWVKPRSSVIGPGVPIRCPPGVTYLLAETELGVVIGRTCHQASVDEAAEAIVGYTCLNDVTAWELYLADRHNQFCSAKVADTFCPLLPHVATDVDPEAGLGMWCRVNGEVGVDASTDHYAFGPSEVVSHVSQLCTLEVGDVVALGAPPRPPVVRPGDYVECEIDGIGTIGNHVVGHG